MAAPLLPSLSESANSEEVLRRLRFRLSWLLFLIGVAAVAWGQWQWGERRLQAGLPWMLTGIVLAAGASLLSPLRRRLPSLHPKKLRPAEKWFLGALILVGASVRFLWLNHAPPGGFFDEVQNILVADGILAGNRPIFVGEMSQMPALFFYFLAAAIKVAGRSVATVRGLSALFGTLTLPAFYFLARRALAWPVAAATALLLAGSRWHITFSRFGLVTIIGPLLEVLAVLFLWKAMETGKSRYYLLLGVVVAIGLQTYYSFNLFPAVLLVAVLAYTAREGWHRLWPELRRTAGGLVRAILVAGILLVPLATFAIRQPQVFFKRTNTVAIWNPAHRLPWPGALWTNMATHLLMFNYRGDGNPRHNIPDAPLLNPIEGVLLAIGFGAAIARAVKWPQAVWLTWFAVMLLPAILTIEAPQAHRAVGAIPAAYLLIGEGLQGIHSLATYQAKRWRAGIAAALLLGLSVAAASQDTYRYFRIQVRDPRVWQAFEADYHAIARFIKPFGDRYDIWVSGLYFDYPILRFHLGETFPYSRFRLGEHLPLSAATLSPRSEGALYVLEPFQRGLYPLFKDLYPHAGLQDHLDPFGRTMFVSIAVPRADLNNPSNPAADRQGFLAAYYQNERWEGAPAIVRREPAVFFHFHWDQEALPGSFTADWAASLQIEEPGNYVFEVMTTAPTAIVLDDHPIATSTNVSDPYPLTGAVQLSRGNHLLLVRYMKTGYGSTIYVSWRPPSGISSVIPMSILHPLSREEYEHLRGQLPRPGVP